jgi:hypothetical protein
MLRILGLVTVVMMLVLGVGAPTQTLAQEWKTYYNPELKFAFDYPDNQTNISDKVSNNT